MIVTSEIRMSASAIYAAYHNLWRIEESFRIMKSQLEMCIRDRYLAVFFTFTDKFSSFIILRMIFSEIVIPSRLSNACILR